MDALTNAAADALAAGDPLGALRSVALREDPPALALRGIALAQLGEFPRARALLRRAARAFGARAPMARARCVLAEAEVALASRDLAWPGKALAAAREVLQRHGDAPNAAHARLLEARHHLLVGELDAAEQVLGVFSTDSPTQTATHQLLLAEIAVRRTHAEVARRALDRAEQAARVARIPALTAEVARAHRALRAPVARSLGAGRTRALGLDEVETLLASDTLVVDARLHVVRVGTDQVSFARRPVLFTLARALGEAWPREVPRDALIARAFAARVVNASHRARLRVEVTRLRKSLAGFARLEATPGGYVLAPLGSPEVRVLARLVESPHAAVLALLTDGEAWSSSALALALGTSQRSVQRALDALREMDAVRSLGQGRSLRWTATTGGDA
jgi:DNA-binding transcriptional ArsR family regulator